MANEENKANKDMQLRSKSLKCMTSWPAIQPLYMYKYKEPMKDKKKEKVGLEDRKVDTVTEKGKMKKLVVA